MKNAFPLCAVNRGLMCARHVPCGREKDACAGKALRAGKRMHVLEELCGGKKDACAGKILRGSKADYDISGGTRDG